MPRDVVLALDLPADADAVIDTLTTRAGQAAFWTTDCDVSRTEARFGFPGAEQDVHVRVDAIDDGKLVRWVVTDGFPGWDDSIVEWELGPPMGEEGGTNLVLRHLGLHGPFDEVDAALGSVAHTWAMILDRLQVHLRDGEPVPYFG